MFENPFAYELGVQMLARFMKFVVDDVRYITYIIDDLQQKTIFLAPSPISAISAEDWYICVTIQYTVQTRYISICCIVL